MKTNLTNLVITLLLGASVQSFASDKVDRFAVLYKQAKSEIQKRTICLDFIDAGLLYEGAPMTDVRKVFQQDFEEMDMDEKGRHAAIVHFVAPKRSSSPLQPDLWTGWYLALTYRSDGTVMHYSLSNESKDRAARLQYEKKIREGRTNEEPGLPVVEPPANQKKGTQP